MYKLLPGFTPPEDPGAVIWRYLDPARLLAQSHAEYSKAPVMGAPEETIDQPLFVEGRGARWHALARSLRSECPS